MKKLTCFLSLLLALTLVASQAGAAEAKKEKKAEPAAFAFTLPDQDGKPVSLTGHAGKIVVLEWVNWECPFWRRHHQAKTMINLAQKYADKGVVLLGVNSTKHHNVAIIKKWHDQHKLPYRVLDDHDGTVGRAYGAKTTPHMFIVDRKGNLVYDGAIDDDPRGRKLKAGKDKNHVDAILARLVAGKAVAFTQNKPYGCSVKYAKK